MNKPRLSHALLFVIIIFTTCCSTYGQFGLAKLEDIRKMKTAPLLVVLRTPNEKKLAKLSRKNIDDAKSYEESIKNYNELLEEAVKKFWGYPNEVTFIKDQNLEEYNSKRNKGKYVIFRGVHSMGDSHNNSLLSIKGANETVKHILHLSGKITAGCGIMHNREYPSAADFKFILQTLQNHLRDREEFKSGSVSKKEYVSKMSKNANVLSQRTLLIDKEDITGKLQSEFGSLYKYPFKMVDKTEIDKAILEESETVSILKIVPFGQDTRVNNIDPTGKSKGSKSSEFLYFHMAINPKDSEILLLQMPKPNLLLKGWGNSKMSKSEVKKFNKSIANSI